MKITHKSATTLNITLGLAIAIALSACGGQHRVDAIAAESILQSTLKEATDLPNPWVAFNKLDAMQVNALAEDKPCFKGECDDVPSWSIYQEEKLRLLKESIDKGLPQAFAYLYNPAKSNSHEFSALRMDSVPKLFKYADSVSGKAEDREVLMAAGRIAFDGDFTIRDWSKAVGYYARAWAADEPAAAGRAALTFLSINDLRNAYLWSLRCTGTCRRQIPIQLETLQEKLSPEAAKQIQKLAANPSIVEIDTKGY